MLPSADTAVFFIRLSRPDLDKSTIITAPNRTVPHILSVTDFHISLQKDTLCAAYLIYSTNLAGQRRLLPWEPGRGRRQQTEASVGQWFTYIAPRRFLCFGGGMSD